ncbi:SWI/SNF complex 60 kDa subunit [Pterulicium gracile]|uniref:SWI/SNF complex 60 kDa subunit n=1 Tax=Pterulicium gracile TaxID=1884261 RepID=A0A5C3Q616_9AGAR|nr:SWI/SNF complex 60 kDa subunit [Pterula gracilis]
MDPKPTKRRILTDKTIPNALARNPEFAEESKMYQDLLDMERKLDWTTMKKRSEIQDTLSRHPTTTRTLRLFLSHSVSSQPWQTGPDGPENPNVETGEGVPSWQLKVEGRMLELPNQRPKDRPPLRKLSTMVKRMVVELDRDPSLYPGGNIVEWPSGAPGQHPPLDGFTVRRTGDNLTNVRVVLYLDHQPPQFKVHPELANVIAIREESRIGVVQALWNYIKVNGLQDKVDRKLIRADDRLKPIFGNLDPIPFHKLPELVNRYLAPPDPILLHYTIDPSLPPSEKPVAWDVEIRTEDVSLRQKISTVLNHTKESGEELGRLDEQIAIHAQSLSNAHLKRTFLTSFADDPSTFIQTWLESQSRDLETVLGCGPNDGATLRMEDLRRSEYFRLPWVEEAIAVQEGMRVGSGGK